MTLREEVWKLEKSIAQYVGTKYAIGVNSGTDALFFSLLALGIGKGDEVITVSNTFIATIQAIVHTGATPILVDVDWNEQMDLEQVKKVITKKTKAIIPVHYTGAMADMNELIKIAKKHKLDIIEDACQALGAKQTYKEEKNNRTWYYEKMMGSFGITGCFSLNTAKMLGGLCDGGMVTTNDRKIYEKICLLRNHWNAHQLSVDRNDYPQPKTMQWAWKSRLSNVNAAFLNIKFKYIKWILERRKEIANKYLLELWHLPNFMIKYDFYELPFEQPGRIWQEFHFRTEKREELAKFLTSKGIETLTRDIIPNHKMKGLGLSHFKLPVTEQLAKTIIRLPLYPEMTNSEIDYVIKCVKQFYDSK